MRSKPRRLGLLGGITWHSSIDYERALNEGVNDALGGSSSADLIVRSYDFQQIAEAQAKGDWDGLAATFRLRPEARFHNGDPVLAADVKHTFDTLLGPYTSPAYKTMLEDLDGLDVLVHASIHPDVAEH